MRRLRFLLWLSLAGIVVAVILLLRGFGVFGPAVMAGARDLPAGHQEIAFISPATSPSNWERLVAGVHRVKNEFPGLIVEEENAFPDQTAAVPEIGLRFAGSDARLWIRWYKMTSETGIERWIKVLARRPTPPLAVMGGGSSDRARDLASALAAELSWLGPPPLLLLTTATANGVILNDQLPVPQPLMQIYPGRTFRCCFNNRQMADAIRDFVWSQPDLRPFGRPTLLLPSVAAGTDSWSCAGWLVAGASLQPATIHVLQWDDDPYSVDLSQQFRAVFRRFESESGDTNIFNVPYSIGGYYTPNSWEARGIRTFLSVMDNSPDQRHLLVLPAVDKPARRILHGLTVVAPLAVRNLVAVSGDSISLNTIYRDRHIAWNIQDMPVPLVFFAHQNPAAWGAVPADQPSSSRTPSSTDEALLNADIVGLLVEAGFGVMPGSAPADPHLLQNADELGKRLLARQPKYFEDDGDRAGGSGEHIVCLRPLFDDNGRVKPEARI